MIFDRSSYQAGADGWSHFHFPTIPIPQSLEKSIKLIKCQRKYIP